MGTWPVRRDLIDYQERVLGQENLENFGLGFTGGLLRNFKIFPSKWEKEKKVFPKLSCPWRQLLQTTSGIILEMPMLHLGGRGRQISEFKASLVYRMSSRISRATQRSPVSKVVLIVVRVGVAHSSFDEGSRMEARP